MLVGSTMLVECDWGERTPAIYHVKITHSAGKVVGETRLTRSTGIFQFFIQGNTLIGPNLGNGSIMFWKYEASVRTTHSICLRRASQTHSLGGFLNRRSSL